MNTLVKNVSLLAQEEGLSETPLTGVSVFKSSSSRNRGPLCYSQGVILVVQGQKRVYFDQQTYNYNPENYLVLTVPLAAECETIVEPDKPLLALMVDFDMGVLNELVRLFDEHGLAQSSESLAQAKGLFVSEFTESLSCVVERLSECLNAPLQADILGPGLVREIMFHILSGPQAAPLFALVAHNTHLSRIERVIKHLHNNYQKGVEVEQLAQMANMSAPSFHRNFKKVTASSPIQYIKRLRLNRARELLLDKGLKVKQAAASVGYESPTQFSREFTRYFGFSPSECGPLG